MLKEASFQQIINFLSHQPLVFNHMESREIAELALNKF